MFDDSPIIWFVKTCKLFAVIPVDRMKDYMYSTYKYNIEMRVIYSYNKDIQSKKKSKMRKFITF